MTHLPQPGEIVASDVIIEAEPTPTTQHSGGWIERNRAMTIDLLDAFSAYQRAGGLSDKTVKRRASTVRSFARYVGDLTSATTDDIVEWLNTKQAPKTKHGYRSDLLVFFRWLERRGVVDENPVESTMSVKLTKPVPRPLGPERESALLTGPRRTRQMVALGMFAGLRCAEIAALDGSDLHMHLTPPMLLVRNGKGGKDRVVPMHPELVELFHDAPPAGPLFPGAGGRRNVSPSSVSALLSRHLKRCGINATGHHLRHTFGTEMTRKANGDLVSVADAMGHGSMETTRGYVGWAGTSATIIAAMYPQGGGDAA